MGAQAGPGRYVVVATAVTVASLVLAGCTSTGQHTSMMGKANPAGASTMPRTTGSASSGPGSGPGMMGGGSGTRYSPLTCAAPTTLPGSVVRVSLTDMGMSRMAGGPAPMGAHMTLLTAPDTVPAGQVTLVASNVGWRTHELVILPLPAGAPAGRRVPGADGKVPETGSQGESSRACTAGSGEGLGAGTVGWTTVTLAAGRYELVCNLPNHYADGMHRELTVS